MNKLFSTHGVLTAAVLLAGLFCVYEGKRIMDDSAQVLASTVSEQDLYHDFLQGKLKADNYDIENPVAFWKATGDNVSYTYTDLNGDQSDELIVKVDEWPVVFTVNDGNVNYTGNGWYSGISGFEVGWNGDIIICDNGHEGREYYWRYRLNSEGTFDLVETIGSDMLIEPEYYRGENVITKAEYDETRKVMLEDVHELTWTPVQ